MSKARDLADLLSGGAAGVPTFGGTGAVRVPNGTEAQRPTGQPGMVRYNSTSGKNEVYDADGWASIATPPSITSVSPTSYDGSAGTSFTISGAFFDSGATVKFLTNSGAEYGAATVTRNSVNELVATTPRIFLVSEEPLAVKVVNSSGLSYQLDSVIDCGGVPNWGTSAGSLGSCYDSMRDGFYVDVSSSDPEGGPVTYSLISGALPTGMSLNSSTGRISGTPNAVSSDTTFNFTLRASDSVGNSTDRAFSITIKAPVEVVFSYTGSTQTFSVPSGLTKLSAYVWGAGGGGGAVGGWSDGSPGGGGGAAYGVINTSAMSSIAVVVGQAGRNPPGSGSAHPSIYGGGGVNTSVTSDNRYGASGGGLSGLFNSSFTHANALLVAGGGGGGGSSRTGGDVSHGGAGGGSVGVSGKSYTGGLGGTYAGKGGTQSAGGAAASSNDSPATSGSALQGGAPGGSHYGGGGGGGYYGGGGGGYFETNDMGGGGGGSGYAHPTLVTSATLYSGSNQTPGNSGNSFNAGAGVGGNENSVGANGRVVVVY